METNVRVVLMNEVVFEFPTSCEDSGPGGNKLWNQHMPCKFF